VTLAHSCIAVVDDEASVRTAIGRLLRLADYVVLAFASGEEFLDSLSARRPACVVLDVHMPGLSGLDVVCRLRQQHCNLPVIFITASDDLTLNAKTAAAGGVRLLRKPFSNVDLLDAVRVAIASDRCDGAASGAREPGPT